LVKKSTFQNRETTPVSAAILNPAVCISDVIGKAGMFVNSVKYVKKQTFRSSLVKREATWQRLKELSMKQKWISFV